MAKLLEEWKEDLVEALTEHDLLLGSKHQKIEHAVPVSYTHIQLHLHSDAPY